MAATLSIIIADSGIHTVTMILRVKDPDGIQTISVIDNDGLPVDIPDHVPGDDCPDYPIAVDLGALPRMRLPLTVTITNCADGDDITTVFEDVGAPGGADDSDGPGIRLPCFATIYSTNSACTEANNRAITSRNRLAILCERLDRIERQLREYLATMIVLGIMLLAFASLAAAASSIPFGWIISLICLAAIAAIIYGLVRLDREWRNVSVRKNEINQEINELRPEFQNAVDEVNATCCLEAIDADLTEPC